MLCGLQPRRPDIAQHPSHDQLSLHRRQSRDWPATGGAFPGGWCRHQYSV